MSTTAIVAVLFLCVFVAVWVGFISNLLRDLAATRDEDLRILTRKGWMVAIVVTFPIGAIMYLRFGKGPRRYV